MKSFLFYDVETSGLNPAFDQILTFACIRTDLSLKEISRELITIQLRRDIVPSPAAFLTHCLTPDELAMGVCEYAAAIQIHQLFNTPGTISIGYNSLGFDDEFLRFLFYRNLLDPRAGTVLCIDRQSRRKGVHHPPRPRLRTGPCDGGGILCPCHSGKKY